MEKSYCEIRKLEKEYKNLESLLYKVFGEKNMINMYHYMIYPTYKVDKKGRRFDWADIISDTIMHQLTKLSRPSKFYMMSYVIYEVLFSKMFLGFPCHQVNK